MGSVRIAVVGATGAVGQEMLRILEDSDVSISELRLLASQRSAGSRIIPKPLGTGVGKRTK